MKSHDTKAVVLSGVTFEDMACALEFTGFAIARTFDPNVYIVTPARRELPRDMDEFLSRRAN